MAKKLYTTNENTYTYEIQIREHGQFDFISATGTDDLERAKLLAKTYGNMKEYIEVRLIKVVQIWA